MTEGVGFNVESIRQALFVAGLLCGFSFTVVVQVITSTLRGKMIFISAMLFLLSSLSFLFALFMGVRLLSDVWRVERGVSSIRNHEIVLDFHSVSMGLGMLLFTLGAGTMGWAYSKLFGVISLVASFTFFALLLWTGSVS